MKAIAAVITTMRAKGMSDSDILDVVEAMTSAQEDIRSAGAARTARWRANRASGVTSDVTVTSHPSPLCPPLSLPQTPTQAPPISPQPVLVGQAAQQRQESDTSRGTRLPLDWQATPEMHSYAMDHGVPPEAIERMDTDFREHWIGKAGAAGRKADWTLTYQTWARREGDKHRAARQRMRDPPRQFNRDPYRSPLD